MVNYSMRLHGRRPDELPRPLVVLGVNDEVRLGPAGALGPVLDREIGILAAVDAAVRGGDGPVPRVGDDRRAKVAEPHERVLLINRSTGR
jgi:hypothetical protein